MRKKDERFEKVPASEVGILNVHQARRNVITGKIEVKVKYYFRDEHGKKHSTDTPWIEPSQAEKVVQALKRKKDKETKLRIRQEEDQRKITDKDFSEKTIEDLLLEFHENNNPKNLSSKSKKRVTTVRSLYTDIGGVMRHHTPASIAAKKAIDITADDFVSWIIYLNSDSNYHEALGGQAVRRYRLAIKKFNDFLLYKGYYSQQQALNNAALIDAVPIKPKKEGRRTDRYVPTKEDFDRIYEHYSYVFTDEIDWDDNPTIDDYYKGYILEKNTPESKLFYLEYWRTYFSLMFYTGMRPEESFGLIVSDINFENKTIDINDAITQAERDDDVEKRKKNNQRQTKRPASKRVIPILDVYLDDLKNYVSKLQKYYDVSDKALQSLYVFPRINARDNNKKYFFQRIKNVNREIDILCEKLNIPHFSVAMFRHACPTFLIIEYHLKEEDLYNYFGHQDTSLLHHIYTELSSTDKTREAAIAFNEAGLISESSLEDIKKDRPTQGYFKEGRSFRGRKKLKKL